MAIHRGPLGRFDPPDRRHEELFPISALAGAVRPTHAPVVLGIPWYEGFDNPQQGGDGRQRIRIAGGIRGGHCICAEPAPQPGQPGQEHDSTPWWTFYNQLAEGACEGAGHSRALSLLTRRTYDLFWLYDDARRAEHAYPEGEGSTNRSACSALVKWGAHFETGTSCHRTRWRTGVPGTQIKSYHWCTTVDQVLAALGLAGGSEIPLLNSWGTQYPERVYLSPEDLNTLLAQEGEADVFVVG